jgi:hypothetical protein
LLHALFVWNPAAWATVAQRHIAMVGLEATADSLGNLGDGGAVRKPTAFLEPFNTKNRTFVKTGSGQT